MKMRMQNLSVAVLWLIAIFVDPPVFAQNPILYEGMAAQSVYVEVFGLHSFFTVNYDRMVSERFGLRAGVGLSGLDGTDGVIVPITVNYLRGDDHKFELAAGLVYENGEWQRGTQEVFPILSVGYRYQPPAGGVMVRVAVDALSYFERAVGAVTTYDDYPGLEPGISLSFGYAF